MNTEPSRPSPDELLKQARRESRGRLKLFLGAAPGVGKTYEMLREGAEKLQGGVDVVVGLVETHGRAETEALVGPFEIVPRRIFQQGPHRLTELDVDALLARRPKLALVDEFAHTNVPGSRHPKRWQDIEELRDAGIDVYSTLNIQHVESLNDVVAGFTRVRVRETVPDAMLDDAEIEVIDLPPDELIERLKAGKVYIPEEATRALGHFFSKSNLSALRELALRRAAQAVDLQMLDHVRITGEAGNWAAGERLLVAIGEQPGGEALIRAAKRLADALRAPWTAITIETPRSSTLSPEARDRMASALKLAASFGAAIATVPAISVAAGLRAQVVESRATAIVIGKSRRSWWFELRHGSVVDQLVRDLKGVSVHVVPTSGPSDSRPSPPTARAFPATGIGAGLAMVAATTTIAKLLQPLVGANAIDLLYLVPVIATATLFGLRASLVASIGSALAYNFFFLPPIYTFTIQDPQNVVTVAVLTGVGILASNLAGRLRQEASIGARTATENAALATFGQRLAAVSDETVTAAIVCDEIARLLGVSTMLLTPRDGRLAVAGASPVDPVFSPVDTAAAQWAFDRNEPAGCETATLTASDWQYHPLATSRGVLGVLGLASPEGGDPLPPNRRILFSTLVGQAALAHERIKLEAEARQVSALQDRDRLRAALLSSIGHDLRTPLTAVIAAADALAAESTSPLVATLTAEAHRLRRFFEDLIEMTRVEAGALVVRAEPTDLTDAVASAVHDLRAELRGHPIDLRVPPTLPLVEADPRLLHHIVINLLGNAAKFAPEGRPITIEGCRSANGVTLSILDEGPGLPPEQEAQLFERFVRVEGDDRTGGTGLGLAIVKGFADAMGLSVEAANRNDRPGSRFSVHWPDAMVRRPQAVEVSA